MIQTKRARYSRAEKAELKRVIARLFCELHGPTYAQLTEKVSEQLNRRLPYFLVQRLASEAARDGTIKFVYAATRLEDLEHRLQQKFSCLKEVVVVTTAVDTIAHLQALGKEAAKYFDKLLEQTERKTAEVQIAISGGRTILAMMEALPERERHVQIYPTALLPCGPNISEVDPFISLSTFWSKTLRNPRAIHYQSVPSFPDFEIEKLRGKYERLRKEKPIQQLWAQMQNVDVVFAGVGQIDIDEGWQRAGRKLLPLIVNRTLGGKKISAQLLGQEGIVGDMSYCLFDADGVTRKKDWNPFPALDTKWFRAMADSYPSKRVVIVGGIGKERALRAALKGRLCNVFITDETAAHHLLADTD